MKIKMTKIFCCFLTPIFILGLFLAYDVKSIPSMILIREGQNFKSYPLIEFKSEENVLPTNSILKSENYKKLNASFLGLVNVKTVFFRSVSDNIEVYPGGQPIGVKLNTKGVLIVALSDVDTVSGKAVSPAVSSGLEIGDSIIKINKKQINNSQEAIDEINKSGGKPLTILVDRKGNSIEKSVTPIKSLSDNNYKIGLWIRDSTAGVGTLTFYDSKSNNFAALGHPITDMDTGTILKVGTGNLISSSIISVKKSEKGNPGELRGIFVNENIPIGNIIKNTQCGIFGSGSSELINEGNNKPIPIALRDEIKEGPAKVLTTIDGDCPKTYDIQIEKLLQQDSPGPKSMIIKITDKELLSKTGGIVQGMSGSPIIQNGKLVGAVTHVLVNKPDTGYAIYIEWMLKDANLIS